MIVYDGSWPGLLTAFFEVYEYKFSATSICEENTGSASLFSEAHTVVTNEEKAKRVLVKLQQKISQKAIRQMYKTFLAEAKKPGRYPAVLHKIYSF